MTEEELRALNQRIIARLKLLQQRNSINSMVKFQVGQRVSFDPDGRMRTGMLVKIQPQNGGGTHRRSSALESLTAIPSPPY
jgi:hypothetical protein